MLYKFNKTLYSRVALIKAAYNYTDRAYIHLDADMDYYYVKIDMKQDCADIPEQDFVNEMLAQSVRHEIYLQTKNIRELLLARAMATTIIADTGEPVDETGQTDMFSEDEILKDWFGQRDEGED